MGKFHSSTDNQNTKEDCPDNFSSNFTAGDCRLGLISVLDLIVIILIWRDCKYMKAKSPGHAH